MHKDFYASGFLYHIPSQQILLQHQNPGNHTSSRWSLFGATIRTHESLTHAFQRIMDTSLDIILATDTISAVYEYYNTELERNHVVVYAEVPELADFPTRHNMEFTWVKLKDIYKLPIPAQMKHDITVGQRVIDAKKREVALLNEA